MQIFSLVSLLIVAGLIMMIFLSKEPEEYVVERESYNQAIDQAESAVGKLEYVPSLSSKAVFIYDGISVPNDVLVVDLSNQGLSGSLKAEIRQLSNLKELNLSNNQFTGLPAEVGQLSQLEKLNLANN